MEDFFNIYLFGVDDAKHVAEEPNEPHVHDYEELLIGLEGQLDHFIDFRSEMIEAPYVSFITAGKMHRLKPLEKDGHCKIWVLRFKSDFIAETSFQLYSSFHDKANMCMKLDGCFGRLNTLCSMINDEYSRQDADMAVIKQLLISLVCIIESEKRKDSSAAEDNKSVQNHTFKSFLQVLEQHYREPRNVDFYAEKLFMTSRNLNLICQRILHQSVSEIVETRKLLEAKNMLIATDKTVAEIGFDLGFTEKTYFTHVFKKKAGISPSDFRKEMRANI
jgi:AraC family transcriptional regulator, transcriptional activator of pobA